MSDKPAEMDILKALVPAEKLSPAEFREWIVDIENRMMSHSQALSRHDDGPIKLKHIFTPGLYTRQIFMPAGSLVMSRIHMWEHPFIISQGRVSVYDGAEIVTLTAPHQGITQAGTKRLLFVHEDTIWTTFHVTNKETLEEIDENGVVTCDTFEEYERIVRKEITI
jgi:hypothetical protein